MLGPTLRQRWHQCCDNVGLLAGKLLLEKSKIDFLFLSETFLNDNIDDSVLQIPKYNLYRCDPDDATQKGSGEGIVLYANQEYNTVHLSSIKSPAL